MGRMDVVLGALALLNYASIIAAAITKNSLIGCVYVALVLVGSALEITQTVAPVTIARAALAVSAASLLAVICFHASRVQNKVADPNAKVWVWVGVHSNDEALVFAPDIFVLVLSLMLEICRRCCGPQSGLRSALSQLPCSRNLFAAWILAAAIALDSLVSMICYYVPFLVGLSLYAQKAQWDWGQVAFRNALPVICGLHLFLRSIVDVFAEIDAVNCDEQTRSFGVCLGNLDFQSIASDLALVGLYFTALTFLVHTRRGSIRESSFLPSESEYRALTDPDEKRAFQKRRGSDRRGSDRTDPAAELQDSEEMEMKTVEKDGGDATPNRADSKRGSAPNAKDLLPPLRTGKALKIDNDGAPPGCWTRLTRTIGALLSTFIETVRSNSIVVIPAVLLGMALLFPSAFGLPFIALFCTTLIAPGLARSIVGFVYHYTAAVSLVVYVCNLAITDSVPHQKYIGLLNQSRTQLFLTLLGYNIALVYFAVLQRQIRKEQEAEAAAVSARAASRGDLEGGLAAAPPQLEDARDAKGALSLSTESPTGPAAANLGDDLDLSATDAVARSSSANGESLQTEWLYIQPSLSRVHARLSVPSRSAAEPTLAPGYNSRYQWALEAARKGRVVVSAEPSCYFDIQIDADTGACVLWAMADAKTRLGALCAAPKGTVLQTSGSTAKLTDANKFSILERTDDDDTVSYLDSLTKIQRDAHISLLEFSGGKARGGLGKFIAVDEDKEEVVCGQPRAGRLGIFKLIRCQNGLFRIWTPAVNAPAGVYIDVLNGNSSGAVDTPLYFITNRNADQRLGVVDGGGVVMGKGRDRRFLWHLRAPQGQPKGDRSRVFIINEASGGVLSFDRDTNAAEPSPGALKSMSSTQFALALAPDVKVATNALWALRRVPPSRLADSWIDWQLAQAWIASKFEFLLIWVEVATLILMYVMACLTVDLVHAVYLTFFAIFIVFSWVRARAWLAVTIYTASVIVVLYTYQLPLCDDIHGDVPSFVGVRSINKASWAQLWPHLLLLMFSSLSWQAHGRVAETEESRRRDPELPLPRGRAASSLVVATGFVACEIVFLFVGVFLVTNNYSIFTGAYLLFALFMQLLVVFHPGTKGHRYRLRRLLFMAAIFAASFMVIQYMYQFGVLNFVNNWLDKIKMKPGQVGLIRNANLVTALAGHSVVLLVCVLQIRIYNTHYRNHPDNDALDADAEAMQQGSAAQLNAMASEASIFTPSKGDVYSFSFRTVLRFLGRVCMLHSEKGLFLAMVWTSLNNVSLFGLWRLGLALLLIALTTKADGWLCRLKTIFILITEAVVLLTMYLYNLLQNIIDPSSGTDEGGCGPPPLNSSSCPSEAILGIWHTNHFGRAVAVNVIILLLACLHSQARAQLAIVREQVRTWAKEIRGAAEPEPDHAKPEPKRLSTVPQRLLRSVIFYDQRWQPLLTVGTMLSEREECRETLKDGYTGTAASVQLFREIHNYTDLTAAAAAVAPARERKASSVGDLKVAINGGAGARDPDAISNDAGPGDAKRDNVDIFKRRSLWFRFTNNLAVRDLGEMAGHFVETWRFQLCIFMLGWALWSHRADVIGFFTLAWLVYFLRRNRTTAAWFSALERLDDQSTMPWLVCIIWFTTLLVAKYCAFIYWIRRDQDGYDQPRQNASRGEYIDYLRSKRPEMWYWFDYFSVAQGSASAESDLIIDAFLLWLLVTQFQHCLRVTRVYRRQGWKREREADTPVLDGEDDDEVSGGDGSGSSDVRADEKKGAPDLKTSIQDTGDVVTVALGSTIGEPTDNSRAAIASTIGQPIPDVGDVGNDEKKATGPVLQGVLQGESEKNPKPWFSDVKRDFTVGTELSDAFLRFWFMRWGIINKLLILAIASSYFNVLNFGYMYFALALLKVAGKSYSDNELSNWNRLALYNISVMLARLTFRMPWSRYIEGGPDANKRFPITWRACIGVPEEWQTFSSLLLYDVAVFVLVTFQNYLGAHPRIRLVRRRQAIIRSLEADRGREFREREERQRWVHLAAALKSQKARRQRLEELRRHRVERRAALESLHGTTAQRKHTRTGSAATANRQSLLFARLPSTLVLQESDAEDSKDGAAASDSKGKDEKKPKLGRNPTQLGAISRDDESSDGEVEDGDSGDQSGWTAWLMSKCKWVLVKLRTYFQDHAWVLTVTSFIAVYAFSPSLLTAVFPISLFAYVAMVNPRVPTMYWRIAMAYSMALIAALYLFQLPVFCICYCNVDAGDQDTYSTVWGCNENSALTDAPKCATESCGKRYYTDLVGFTKFQRTGSHGSSQAFIFFKNAFWLFLVLLALINQRFWLLRNGLWDHMNAFGSKYADEASISKTLKQPLLKSGDAKADAKDGGAPRKGASGGSSGGASKALVAVAGRKNIQGGGDDDDDLKKRTPAGVVGAATYVRYNNSEWVLGQIVGVVDAASSATNKRVRRATAAELRKRGVEGEALLLSFTYNGHERTHLIRPSQARLLAPTDDTFAKNNVIWLARDGVWVPARVTHSYKCSAELDIKQPSGDHTSVLVMKRPVPAVGVSARAYSGLCSWVKGVSSGGQGLLQWIYGRSDAKKSGVGVDNYGAIVGVQLLMFLVLLIGYDNGQEIQRGFTQSRVSEGYVVSIFSMFLWICVDRVVYLYRSHLAKFIVQVLSIIISMTLFLEGGRLSTFETIMFILTAVYWALSAQQFRAGFPATIVPTLVKPNWFAGTVYGIYRAIPFVFELRTLLDWSCNPTVLYFGEWLKLEDVWAKMYLVQCNLSWKKRAAQVPGVAQATWKKWVFGWLVFVLLALVVWGPLFLFVGGPRAAQNLAQIRIEAGVPDYEPFVSTTQITEYSVSDGSWANWKSRFGYLSGQDRNDLTSYALNFPSAATTWPIVPTALDLLDQTLNATAGTAFLVSLSFVKDTGASSAATQFIFSFTMDFDALTAANLSSILLQARNGDSGVLPAAVPAAHCYPKFVYLPSAANPQALSTDDGSLENCTLVLDGTGNYSAGSGRLWWYLLGGDAANDPNYEEEDAPTVTIELAGGEARTYRQATFQIFRESLVTFGTFSVALVPLYLTFVYTVGQFVRLMVTGKSTNIIYEDLGDAWPILGLVHDIYLARADRQLDLEEFLYVELINILRSPARLLQLTGEFARVFPTILYLRRAHSPQEITDETRPKKGGGGGGGDNTAGDDDDDDKGGFEGSRARNEDATNDPNTRRDDADDIKALVAASDPDRFDVRTMAATTIARLKRVVAAKAGLNMERCSIELYFKARVLEDKREPSKEEDNQRRQDDGSVPDEEGAADAKSDAPDQVNGGLDSEILVDNCIYDYRIPYGALLYFVVMRKRTSTQGTVSTEGSGVTSRRATRDAKASSVAEGSAGPAAGPSAEGKKNQ